MLVQNIKRTLYAGLSATLFTACGNSLNSDYYNSANGEKITLGMDNPVCQEGSVTQKGRVIDSGTHKGISYAEVNLAGCTTHTDKDGYYTLSDITAMDRTSVNVEKKGYSKNSAIITTNKKSQNYVEIDLNKYKSDWSFKSTKGTTNEDVRISDDTTYTTDSGDAYEGSIDVAYSLDNINYKNKDKIPGDFHGIDANGVIVNFETYALMILDLTDNEGNALRTSKPVTLKLTELSSIEDETIALWYYDYNKGIWIQDGYAHKDENGDFICEISHQGTWTLSKPVETEMGLYVGHIVDENENPISHVRLKAEGNNWINKDLTTDENGEFKIYVVPGQKFALSAYDYEEKYSAKFPNKIEAIASGDVVED